jgi:hypothetical protein
VRVLCGVEEGVDRLLLGRVDESAGVDDDDVGALGGGRPVARRDQPPGEPVRIGLVLRAAQRLDEEAGGRDGPQR